MIHFLLRRSFEYTIEDFLKQGGSAIAGSCRILTYEDALCASDFASGVYVFTDLERLSLAERQLAAQLWNRLTAEPDVSALNHPTTSLTRYDLLRKLEVEGINSFKARRATGQDVEEVEFPVFLRREDNHDGPITPLISSRTELMTQIVRLRMNGYDLDKVIAVEFCDASDDQGVFTKYGAYILRDRILPRHLWFSKEWVVRSGTPIEASRAEQETKYVRENPHAETIRSIATLAGIEYGRIDFTLKDGRVQVWEINTNPHIQWSKDRWDPLPDERKKRESKFFAAFGALLSSLDHPHERTFAIRPVLASPMPVPHVSLDGVTRSRLQGKFARLSYETQMKIARLFRAFSR
ncbi:MAG: hypothetical protein QOK47_330 [Actinomycetota bacterium]|nr:hypothetical protein [Actinomycetota bacterium]